MQELHEKWAIGIPFANFYGRFLRAKSLSPSHEAERQFRAFLVQQKAQILGIPSPHSKGTKAVEVDLAEIPGAQVHWGKSRLDCSSGRYEDVVIDNAAKLLSHPLQGDDATVENGNFAYKHIDQAIHAFAGQNKNAWFRQKPEARRKAYCQFIEENFGIANPLHVRGYGEKNIERRETLYRKKAVSNS